MTTGVRAHLVGPVARSFVISVASLFVVVGIASVAFPQFLLSSDYPESLDQVRAQGAIALAAGLLVGLPLRVGAFGRAGALRIALLLVLASAPVVGAVRGCADAPGLHNEPSLAVGICLLLVVIAGAPALAAFQLVEYRRMPRPYSAASNAGAS